VLGSWTTQDRKFDMEKWNWRYSAADGFRLEITGGIFLNN
jgi:hypothetical protein